MKLHQLTFLPEIRRTLKKNIIKIVSFEDEFPNLERSNQVSSEIFYTPDAQQMPLVDEVKHLKTSSYSTPSCYTTILYDVLYCPEYNILLTKSRKIIKDSFIPHIPPEDFKLSYLFRRNIERIPGYCTIIDQASNHYYHKIIDNIPRFYLTCQHEILKNSRQNVKLIYTSNILDDYFIPKLLPNNISPTCLQSGKLYNIEKLIFSKFLTTNLNGCLPTLFREIIYSQFLPKRDRVKMNRIYISRDKAPLGRRVLNEVELLEMLQPLGFKKYYLEDLQVSDQIELFYDAEVVVAPHGAGLTNLIFSQKAKVLELFQRPLVTPTYYFLSVSMGHNYQYLCSPEKDNNHYSAFNVDIAQVKLLIEKLLETKT